MQEAASVLDLKIFANGRRPWTPTAVLRVAAIVAVAALLALLLHAVYFVTLPRFATEAEQATRRAADWVRSAAARQRQAIGETEQVLRSVAGLSSLANVDPDRCQAFFVKQADRHPEFGNLGVVRPDGQVLCSARPFALSAALGARLSAEARRDGLGVLPDAGGLLFGVAVGSSAAAPVVFATRALPGLDGGPVEAGGAGDMVVELFTRSGFILARHPDAARLSGGRRPDAPLIAQAARLGGGSGKLAGPDGVSRFYAFVALDIPGADRRYLAAGSPVGVVHADTRQLLYFQLALILLLAATLAILSGIGGDRFLPRRIAAIADPSLWANRARAFWRGRPAALRPLGLLDAATQPVRRHLSRAGRQWLGERDELEQQIESLRHSAAEMAKLSDMSQLLQSCVSVEELHGVVARFAQELFPGTRGALYMIRESRNIVETAVAWGEPAGTSEMFMPEDCWAVRLGKTHGSEDPHAGPQCAHVAEFPPGGYLCVPMVVHGEVLGTLHLQCDNPPAAEAGERENRNRAKRQLAQTFAERTALALSNLQLRESLRAQSVRDPLTGLYNRRFLNEAMEIETHRAQRRHTPIGIVMVDIDHFKRFNDSYGHVAGDALLHELGNFLHEQVREEDIPCRYGGEEFIVILPGATLEASRERAEALRNGIGGLTFEYQGKQLGPITLSLGVACYFANGPSWPQIVKAADAALYRAKEGGRNRVCLAD